MGLIPFFVADRPASLQLLSNVKLANPNINMGIMSHALTTKNFWKLNKNFPFINNTNQSFENKKFLSDRIIKIADSGIFNKNGCNLNYNELFKIYNALGVEYGIIIDVLKNSEATIKSAALALKVYNRYKRYYKFKLVAVAQGNTLEEYLDCFNNLRENFEHIAIGGLLRKRENSARFVTVRNEKFMYDIISAIKKDFSPEWLFILGCYHPKRHKKFEKLGVWGSDYKGWIFNYKSKLDTLETVNNNLMDFEINDGIDGDFKVSLLEIKLIQKELLKSLKRYRNTKNKYKKREIYQEIKESKLILEDYFNILLLRREKLIQEKSLNRNYLKSFKTYKEVIKYNEQEWRFYQIKKFIETQIFSLMN